MLKTLILALGLAPAMSATGWAVTLTTEAQLEQPQTAQDIEDFWKQHAILKPMTGERDVEIMTAKIMQTDRTVEKGAIVIVSGRTESMLKYKELVRDLWNDGWSVYIHDHRGQGLSGREPEVKATLERGYVHDFQDFAKDLRSVVTRQVLPEGHKRHMLLAHSMGGVVAALFLEQGGPEVDRFDAAALSSPMLAITSLAGKKANATCIAAKGLASVDPTGYVIGGSDYDPPTFKKNLYTQSPVRYERLLKQYASDPYIRLGSATHGWLSQACEAAAAARAEAKKVRTPMRVVIAGRDGIVHNSGAEDFCKGLPKSLGGCGGPGGGPIVVAGARHELFIERDPMRQQALQPILTFFTSKL